MKSDSSSQQPNRPDKEDFDLDVDDIFLDLPEPPSLPIIPLLPAFGETLIDQEWKTDRGHGKMYHAKREGVSSFTRTQARLTTRFVPESLSSTPPSPSIQLPEMEPLEPLPPRLPAAERSVAPLTLSGGNLQALRPRRNPLATTFWLVGATLIVLGLWSTFAPAPVAPAESRPVSVSTIYLEKISQARGALFAYLQAPSSEDKLRSILEPDRLRTKVRDFYERFHYTDPRINPEVRGEVQEVPQSLWVQFTASEKESGNPCRFRLRETTLGFKLDWEALVGPGSMPWAAFCKERPEAAERMIVLIKSSDWYRGLYADQFKYQAYELRALAGGPPLIGYVEKATRSAQQMKKAHQLERENPLTLLLSFAPGTESAQVRILDVDPNPPR